MLSRKITTLALLGSLSLSPLVGCESLPGNDKQQGTVIGGVGGALAGAAIAKDNRGLGALVGGALGAGGGYLIGANKDKITGGRDRDRDEAVRASERAERNPAGVGDVARVRTADLNTDGFVTLDEVVAMERAGLDDREQIDRLERTQQVFELTEQQERYLEDRGVSRNVVLEMRSMNQSVDARTASDVSRVDPVDRSDRLDRTERLDRAERLERRDRTRNDIGRDDRDDRGLERFGDRFDRTTPAGNSTAGGQTGGPGYDRERSGDAAR